MTDLQLGKIITTEQERDAIHVAVAPVTASETLYPGQLVSLLDGDKASASGAHIGIVDPFLQSRVYEGQRFWLWLFPNTVTGMRHHWQHPAFSDAASAGKAAPDVNASKAWIEHFARSVGLEYETVIEAARDFLETGDRFIQRDSESARDEMYDDETRKEFWLHYGILTGNVFASGLGNPFCCTC